MKKQPTRIIIAIGTTISGHDNYIAGRTKTLSGLQYLPRYTTDPVYAVEFYTVENAETYIKEILNHHNRLFRAVTIQIPDIPDTRQAYKKYDHEKKSAAQQTPLSARRGSGAQTNNSSKLGEALLAFILLIVLVSCTKQSPGIYEKINCDVYEMRINYYTLDTVPMIMKIGAAAGKSTYTWYIDTLCDTRIKGNGIDTLMRYGIKDIMDNTAEAWNKMCPAPGQPYYWLEQWYYLKNGKKIQPSKYPLK